MTTRAAKPGAADDIAAIEAATPPLANAQNAQLVMLVEAVMLGYALARGPDRAAKL